MRQDVHERLVLERIIRGRPIGNVSYSVLLEQLRRVFAETPKKVIELALISVIHAKLVDRCGGCRRARLVLSRSKPFRSGKQRYCGKRLKQGSSFHGGNSTRSFFPQRAELACESDGFGAVPEKIQYEWRFGPRIILDWRPRPPPPKPSKGVPSPGFSPLILPRKNHVRVPRAV